MMIGHLWVSKVDPKSGPSESSHIQLPRQISMASDPAAYDLLSLEYRYTLAGHRQFVDTKRYVPLQDNLN